MSEEMTMVLAGGPGSSAPVSEWWVTDCLLRWIWNISILITQALKSANL